MTYISGMVVGITIGIAVVTIPLVSYHIFKYLRKRTLKEDIESVDYYDGTSTGASNEIGAENRGVQAVGNGGLKRNGTCSAMTNGKQGMAVLVRFDKEKNVCFDQDWVEIKELRNGINLSELQSHDEKESWGKQIDPLHENETASSRLGRHPRSNEERRKGRVGGEDSTESSIVRTPKIENGNCVWNSNTQIEKEDNKTKGRRLRSRTTNDLVENIRIDEIVASWDELIHSTPRICRPRVSTDVGKDGNYTGSDKTIPRSPRTGSTGVFLNKFADQKSSISIASNWDQKELFLSASHKENHHNDVISNAGLQRSRKESGELSEKAPAKGDLQRRKKLKRVQSYPRMLDGKVGVSDGITENKTRGEEKYGHASRSFSSKLHTGTARLETLCQNLEMLSKKC